MLLIIKVVEKFSDEGFKVIDITYSPIKGGQGNIEFLAYIQREKHDDKHVFFSKDIIHKVVEEAHTYLKE